MKGVEKKDLELKISASGSKLRCASFLFFLIWREFQNVAGLGVSLEVLLHTKKVYREIGPRFKILS